MMPAVPVAVMRLAALLAARILAAHRERASLLRDEYAGAPLGPIERAEDDRSGEPAPIDAPILQQMGYPLAGERDGIRPLSSHAAPIEMSERAYAKIILDDVAEFSRRKRRDRWVLVSLRHGHGVEDRTAVGAEG
jgi:hypothetical protein